MDPATSPIINPSPLSPSVEGFLRRPADEWSLRRLWRALPTDWKLRGMEAALTPGREGSSELRRALLHELARVGGFRPQSLATMSPSEVAKWAARMSGRALPLPELFFRAALVNGFGPLLSAYLDSLGIPHRNGVVLTDDPPPPDPRRAQEAADHLFRRFAGDDVVAYLVALVCLQSDLAPGMDAFLQRRVREGHRRPEEGRQRSQEERQRSDEARQGGQEGRQGGQEGRRPTDKERRRSVEPRLADGTAESQPGHIDQGGQGGDRDSRTMAQPGQGGDPVESGKTWAAREEEAEGVSEAPVARGVGRPDADPPSGASLEEVEGPEPTEQASTERAPTDSSRVDPDPPTPTDPDAPEPELVQDARVEEAQEDGLASSPFSPLDRMLIRGAVDAAQGVQGAPERAEVEDMVEELIQLNGTRHRTFFHRGFVDALWEMPYRSSLPAENDARRDWYLAGWISGLGRRGEWNRIVEVVEATPPAKLFRRGKAPARLAAPLVFEALAGAERAVEALPLLPAGYLAEQPVMLPRLLEVATARLRKDDAEAARPLLDRLHEVIGILERAGQPTEERFFLEVRRRRAHCYRQLSEPQRARTLLEGLLEHERDPRLRAMVLADLGLLDAGLRSLSEVRLGRSRAEMMDLVHALARGEPRFREALMAADPPTGHGAWPLGILAMAGEDWPQARSLLVSARAAFLQHPDRYQERSLWARVTLAAGVAEALALDYARLPRARDLIMEGLEGGGELSAHLVPDVLAALEEHEDDLAGPLLRRLTASTEDEVLDPLTQTGSGRRSPAVVEALLRRAEQPDRSLARAAADLRTAFRLLSDPDFPLHRVAPGRGRRILDRLEELARLQEVGRDQFLELLLTEPDRLSPHWSHEEARWAAIPILEAMGRDAQALELLRHEFRECLAGHRGVPFQLEEAEAILARVRSLNLDRGAFADMEARLSSALTPAEKGEEEPLARRHAHQPHRVLIVGGDEGNHTLGDRVQQMLRELGEPIEVEHLAPGWSGNWSGNLDKALSKAERADAVVILRYVRTEFGRSLRAGLERPWVSCPGVGTAQVTRMVRKAARWGSEQKRS